jgi:hypothetical protein
LVIRLPRWAFAQPTSIGQFRPKVVDASGRIRMDYVVRLAAISMPHARSTVESASIAWSNSLLESFDWD